MSHSEGEPQEQVMRSLGDSVDVLSIQDKGRTHDGKKGVIFQDTEIQVTPLVQAESVADLNAFTDTLLQDVPSVGRAYARAHFDETSKQFVPGRLRAFRRDVDQRTIKRVDVVVLPNR